MYRGCVLAAAVQGSYPTCATSPLLSHPVMAQAVLSKQSHKNKTKKYPHWKDGPLHKIGLSKQRKFVNISGIGA